MGGTCFRWAVRVVVRRYLSSVGVHVEGRARRNHDLRRGFAVLALSFYSNGGG